MKGNTTYIIAGLGQLVKSSVNKSIEEFALLKLKYSSLPSFINSLWLNTQLVKLYLLFDKLFYKTIDQYKLGRIDTEQFKKRILNQIGVNQNSLVNDEFEHAWNKMCEISEDNLDKVAKLIVNEVENENVKVIIFSGTNELQYDYVKNRISTELDKKHLGSNYSFDNLGIVTSFANQTLSNPELAKIALGNKSYSDDSTNSIISFSKNVTKESLAKAGLKVDNVKFESKQINQVELLNHINNTISQNSSKSKQQTSQSPNKYTDLISSKSIDPETIKKTQDLEQKKER